MANTHDEQLVLIDADDEMVGLGKEVMVPGDIDVVFKTEDPNEEAAGPTRSVVHRGSFRFPSHLNVPMTRQIQGIRRIGLQEATPLCYAVKPHNRQLEQRRKKNYEEYERG